MQTTKSVQKRRRLAWEVKVFHVGTTERRGLGGGSGACVCVCVCVCVCEREREKYLESRYPEAVYLVAKAVSCTVFLPSLGWRTGLGPRTFPPQEIKKPMQPMPSLSPHVGTSFLICSSVCAPFFCFYLHPWPSCKPQAFIISNSRKEGLGSFCFHTRGVHRGQLACIGCTILRATCGP